MGKISEFFIWNFQFFGGEISSIYLNRHVSVIQMPYMKPPAHEQKKAQQRNRLGTFSRKLTRGFNQFYMRKTPPLNLLQLQITIIYSVRTGLSYLIIETYVTSIIKHDERKQRTQHRSEARTQENPQTGPKWAQSHALIVSCQTPEKIPQGVII